MGLMSLSVQAKELVIERSFSISYIKVPAHCELDSFKSTCTRLVNYYARRFEREMVSNISVDYDEDDPFANDIFGSAGKRQKSVQHVTMSIYSKPGEPLLTLFSVFKQNIVGNPEEQLLVETMNFESQTGRIVRFGELFAKPQLAAMLCARAIEARYQSDKSPLLPVVIAATELAPSNFIITARGLRFFFAPSLVKPNSNKTDSMLIPLEALKSAQPVDKWWSRKVEPITKEHQQALSNSSLKDVINLDEEMAARKALDPIKAGKLRAASHEDELSKGHSSAVVQR